MRTFLIPALICMQALAFAEASPAQAVQKIAPCCRAVPPAGKSTDKSLYLLQSKWTSDRGVTVPLSVLRGRPQVVAMFFANCEYACPILLNDLKKLEARLPATVRAQTDFLLVTIDPKRDTPETLAAFREKTALPIETWTLLRGSDDDTRELAALLGVNYAPESRGQFAHSNLLTVLNPEGEICFQQAGLQADHEGLVAAIAKAAADAKR